MSSEASAASGEARTRAWWRDVVAVLHQPGPVFRALRDQSRSATEARQEPILAIIFLAGIAAILSFSETTREILDDPDVDGALVPILVFLGGAIYGFVGYWIGGFALYLGIRGAKGENPTYRQARHALSYALVPLVLSLVLWPFRVGIYGGDVFRTGGGDDGAATWIFTGLAFGFLTWSLVVLVTGLRALYDWTAIRAIGALALMGLALFGLAVLFGGLPAAWI